MRMRERGQPAKPRRLSANMALWQWLVLICFDLPVGGSLASARTPKSGSSDMRLLSLSAWQWACLARGRCGSHMDPSAHT